MELFILAAVFMESTRKGEFPHPSFHETLFTETVSQRDINIFFYMSRKYVI